MWQIQDFSQFSPPPFEHVWVDSSIYRQSTITKTVFLKTAKCHMWWQTSTSNNIFLQAQAPDDLTVRRGDWVYADLSNQTVDGW